MPGYRDPGAFNRWGALLQARNRLPSSDRAAQNYLGGLEHGAYAESVVRERPVTGPLLMSLMIPGYTAAKALGLRSGRSEPSLHEMWEGYRGLGRGYAANLGDMLSQTMGDPQPIAKPPVSRPMSQGMTPEQLTQYVLRHYR